MQKTQNADIQRVMNLVDFYRTKVGKESRIAKTAKSDYDYWEEENLKNAEEDFAKGEVFSSFIHGEGPHTEVWIKGLMVNEQLLGHFYAEVAGENAEKEVLDQLLPGVYDKSVFTEEDECFLKSHFREMVNYIIQTPNNDLEWVYRSENKDMLVIPDEVLELISSRIEIAAGSTIYYPYVGLAQLTELFRDCKFLCEKKYAWSRVALYANNVYVEFLSDKQIPSSYDALVSFLPKISEGGKDIRKLSQAYENLQNGGLFILLCPSKLFIDEAYFDFRNKLVEDNSIREILQLPSVMSEEMCLIIAEKGKVNQMTTLIDARFAGKDSSRKDVPEILDVNAFMAMIHNSGKEASTGLRKAIQVPSSKLNPNLLIPQIYVVERPTENEGVVPLSELCSIATMRISDITFDLPEDTPWVELSDLSRTYKGALDLTTIKKAECPNNPLAENGTKDYAFDEFGKFVDDWWSQIRTSKGLHVLEYRRCTYLNGNKDAVLLWVGEENVGVAVAPAKGNPVAIGMGIKCFIPNENVTTQTLVALLEMPIVYRQIRAYKKFGLEKHLDDILVPADKRVINDEEQRLVIVENSISALEKKLANHKKSVRMRKHALTQSLSSIEAMFSALNSCRIRKEGSITDDDVISRIKGTTVREAFEFLSKRIKEMMPVLEHIADIEYTFSTPEMIDPEKFIENYILNHEKEWLNFKPVITWGKGHNLAKMDIKDPYTGNFILKKGDAIHQFSFPVDALEDKVLANIISNAQSHAFTDDARKDYKMKFSWHTTGTSLIIEVENNGTPIPDDRDTASLLEYGVSTVLHHNGHNGIGCNEIDDIMQRYDGSVEIVSSPQSEFTVKYILTFNRTNIRGIHNV